jgi:cytochrome c biogenesis protein CcdA/thiol-disulfide isomerase/thioredoxin
MIVLLVFAFLAGLVTVLSPCILPVLPVVLSGSVGGGRARPLGIITGFAVGFTVFTLALTALVKLLGISADLLRYVAAGIIFAFGLVMVVPPIKNAFMRLASGFSRVGGRAVQPSGSGGYPGGIVLGLSLGLVWTPCVGPIMASVIALAVTSKVDVGAVFITVAYTLGTSIPLFLIMLGGRGLLHRFSFFNRHSDSVQKLFGGLMIVTALALFTGADRQFQDFILKEFPGYGAGLTSIENQGQVLNALSARKKENTRQATSGSTVQSPLLAALSKGGPWINSKPLTPLDLEGKVVLVDFWTYSCVNCIRTFPYLKAWYADYRNRGFVIIGVHTPEFAFERETANVKRAVAQFGIEYPVVQDNDYRIWNAFDNLYWPAHYLFDRKGVLSYTHFGEGDYDKTEREIRTLLGGKSGALAVDSIAPTLPTTPDLTPETYLGYARAERFASPGAGVRDQASDYSLPATLSAGQWALSGTWVREAQDVRAAGAGAIELSFHARHVYLVLGPATGSPPPTLKVTVNGRPTTTDDVQNGALELGEYRLYTLFNGNAPINGIVKIETPGPMRAYAFTFG